MRFNPLVSIILPTYNRGYCIERSIKSVLNQTYGCFELIIIDDGSTDNTKQIIKRIDDSRIKYYRLIKNVGQSKARNYGIKKSKGTYIAFQDSDDKWLKDKLEKQMNYFSNHPEFSIVYCSFYRITPKKTKLIPSPKIKIREGDIKQTLLSHGIIGLPTAVIKKSCFDEEGLFDERLHAFEDQELFIRFSKKYLFGFIEKPLFIAYGKDNISDRPELMVTSLDFITKKYYVDYKQNKRGLCRQYFKIMDAYVRLNKKEFVKKFYKKIYALDRTYLKPKICYYIYFFFGHRFYSRLRDLFYY